MRTSVRPLPYVLRNSRTGGYHDPSLPRGVSVNDPARAARWDTEAEAIKIRDRLNSTEVRGGERLLDDGWVVVPVAEAVEH
jgi:hypothetical protein